MTDHTARPSGDAAPVQDNRSAERPDAGLPQAEEERIAALVETLAKENAESKDRVLRTLAEMENLRKRTEREVSDSRQYAVAAFARDVIAVGDNMERALQALETDLEDKADPSAKALLDGVEMTQRELLKVLEKHGVTRFDPAKGEKFDPNLHQAMYEVPDPSQPAGTIATVMQSGYMIGERMLRPALVGVAKGGPKPAASPTPANDQGPEAS